MKIAIFLVALVVASVRASPLEGRPLKDDAEDYSIDYAADYDMSGDEEEWPEEFLETGEPSEFYLQEVREQLENRTAPQAQPLTRSRRYTIPAIQHGSTIGLQYRILPDHWLSCAAHRCDRRTCPGLYLTAADNHCYGEKFRIYRARGPGTVQTGNLIGIYYPHDNVWLGCAGSDCVRASCPGTPSTTYGFQDGERWLHCYGEVFQIYARGKGIGEAIEEHDHVSLYHVQRQRWLSLSYNIVRVQPCPGSVRPPPPHVYEVCWGETLEIWTW